MILNERAGNFLGKISRKFPFSRVHEAEAGYNSGVTRNANHEENEMKTITFEATTHKSVHEAIQYLDCSSHDVACSIKGLKGVYTMIQSEFERLDFAGVIDATWHHNKATGRIMSVPRD